mgnify:FL=1|tara:strand:- start:44 stop:298 length:255 start_codon:yes stop_codon:yes gene_type:complete
MKKRLSSCIECGEESSILTQVTSGVEVIFLCSDCYNLKYSKEVQNEITHVNKKKVKKNIKKPSFYGLRKFNYLIFKFLCFRFRL